MKSKITKWGNSQGIRLPKTVLDELNLIENDAIEITVEGNNIVIKKEKPVAPFITIQQRFHGFTGEYEPVSIDWGEPVGDEVW